MVIAADISWLGERDEGGRPWGEPGWVITYRAVQVAPTGNEQQADRARAELEQALADRKVLTERFRRDGIVNPPAPIEVRGETMAATEQDWFVLDEASDVVWFIERLGHGYDARDETVRAGGITAHGYRLPVTDELAGELRRIAAALA